MSGSEPRTYRNRLRAGGLVSFRICAGQTDILVRAERRLEKEAKALLLEGRLLVEGYIKENPAFSTTLVPWKADLLAPGIVLEMISASVAAGVGPMAAVAGALAEYVGRGLSSHSQRVIVENGGDIHIRTDRPVTVAVLAGDSPLSGRFGIKIFPEKTPLGVCSSSGRVGHSLSRGKAHAACVVSPSTSLADAAATALGNMVSEAGDLEKAADSVADIDGVAGGVVIAGGKMAVWGDVELVEL